MKHSSLFLLSFAVMLSACSSSSSVPPASDVSSSSSSLSSMTSSTQPSSATVWDGSLLKGKHVVTLKTSKGDITLELDADIAPKTVTNFVVLSKSGYYNGLTFHRVIPTFMIQGGDPTGNGTGGKSIFGAEFEDEIDASSLTYKVGYKAGVIAMANRGPNTNGSQFFIMDQDYPLPPNYTIFGHVTKGQDIVNAIANVERDGRDMPREKVTFSVQM
jgi:cyclophilin family peptidyl-prolyl cis-trans isomerase